MKPCGDCGATPGQMHTYNCDVTRCQSTGQQLLQCQGTFHEYNGRQYGQHEGPCGPTVWTGEWPGDAECREFGWFTADGQEDLNRIYREAAMGNLNWDREQQRWVKVLTQ